MVRHTLTADVAAGATRFSSRHPALSALLVALAVSCLLWLLNIPFRRAYQASDNDVTALVDGLLLLPGAHWQDWFTQGHAHFFDSYPEWPWGLTPFARPVFQFTIYLAHFVFGRDWASYLAINYLAVGGIAAVVFAIARSGLGLGSGAALLAAALTIVSPAVLEFSVWEVGFASESLICVLAGCAFLAAINRRDASCVGFLLIALFTKETAVWTPLAAALTVLLREAMDETPRRRLLSAAAMLSPLGLWLGYRLICFGGTGGSYATGGYDDVVIVVNLIIWKLTHLYRLFVSQQIVASEGAWSIADRVLMIGTYLLVMLQIILWALAVLRAATEQVGQVLHKHRWPAVGRVPLVSLWAVTGFAFYFALALSEPRYAASAVMFFWPATVSAVVRRGRAIYSLGLIACLMLMLGRSSLLLASLNPPSAQIYIGRLFHSISVMESALRSTPADVQQVYILSSGGLVTAAPEYIQAFLRTPGEIIRVIDIHWYCAEGPEFAAFDHAVREGVVTISATLPADCASFFFDMAGPASTSLVDHQLRRSDSITYEMPEANRIGHKGPLMPALEPGRRMVVRIRPQGRARFMIEHASTDEVTWFDFP